MLCIFPSFNAVFLLFGGPRSGLFLVGSNPCSCGAKLPTKTPQPPPFSISKATNLPKHSMALSLVLLKPMLHHHHSYYHHHHAARVHTFSFVGVCTRQRGALELPCLLVPSFCLSRLPTKCCVSVCPACLSPGQIIVFFLFPFPEHGPNLAPTVSLAGRAASSSDWVLLQRFSRVTTINFLAPD